MITSLMNKCIVFIFILLVSCKKEKNNINEIYYSDGILKTIEYYDDNGNIDSINHFYKNANRLRNIVKHGEKEFITNFYENGNIESKGTVKNGHKIGWWITFNNDGLMRNRYEFMLINGKEHVNQTITYDKTGKIIKNLSNYFNIEFPNNFKIGKTKINVEYKSLDDDSDIFICVGYNINKDFSNLSQVRIDTFYFENSDPKKWLGLKFTSGGKKTVRGFIYEKSLQIKNNVNSKGESELVKVESQRYFEKEISVNDN